MSRSDDIIRLIDAGLGHADGWSVPHGAGRCGRVGCTADPVDGHDFCEPCLKWLRDDTTAVAAASYRLPDEDQPNLEPVDEIVAWVETYGGLP